LDTHPPYQTALRGKPSQQYNYDNYVSELNGRLQTAHHVAKKNLTASRVRSKHYYDKGTEMMKIEVGDKVLLYDETLRRGRSRKMSSQWIGPYEVVEVNNVNATIKKGRKLLISSLEPYKSFLMTSGRLSGKRKNRTFVFVLEFMFEPVGLVA
jgi:hypothetical protein